MKLALRPVSAVLMSLALAACATMPARTPYTPGDLARASVLPGQTVRFWGQGDDDAYRLWSEALRKDRAASGLVAPRTLLALSGGSDKGAFGAGLLASWSRTGARPEFDIVTGVSTGALIAPFAFLGASQDAALTAIYTNIGRQDIFRPRPLNGLFGGPSLLDSKPLARLIARYVTPELLGQIAAEHRRGRRLLVMTTQLDAQRGAIWDMGAIAASASPERLVLFRQVLLASASIPGAFPPVLIDATIDGRQISEMHVDGGAIGGFFTLPIGIVMTVAPGPQTGAAIFLVYNGVLEPDFEIVKPRTFSVMSHALSTVLGQLDRNNVEGLRAFAKERKAPFYVCALAPSDLDKEAPLFDRKNMRALYAIGERRAAEESGCLRRPVAQ